jgi:glycolate oxidase
MMDQLCLQAVEEFIHAGLPVHQAAALLVEVVGRSAGVAEDVERIRALAADRHVGDVRVAADDAERALLWKGRKSAFGAIARIKPNYYLHDTVVPRHRLPEVLEQVYEIAARHELLVLNVFHAGDGNLHPLLVYDAREPGVAERVHAAGDEIVRVSVACGGVLSGEHGIGLEKRDLMPLMFSPVDLDAQAALRRAFDPGLLANPDKVLPRPAGCADIHSVPDGAWV